MDRVYSTPEHGHNFEAFVAVLAEMVFLSSSTCKAAQGIHGRFHNWVECREFCKGSSRAS